MTRAARLVVVVTAALALGGCVEILALVASVAFGSASVVQRYQQHGAQQEQSEVLRQASEELKQLREEVRKARQQLKDLGVPEPTPGASLQRSKKALFGMPEGE